jgi:hypothetical protein
MYAFESAKSRFEKLTGWAQPTRGEIKTRIKKSNGPANLEGAAANDRVLAYVNQQGLRAIGTVLGPQVRSGSGIFIDDNGNQLPDEYHLNVQWEVVPLEGAICAADVANQFGYSLPVRSVFAKLHRGSVALRLEQELRLRAEPSKSG